MYRARTHERSVLASGLLLCLASLALVPGTTLRGESASAEDEEIDYASLQSPIPFSSDSVARGRVLYERHCTECHGHDGKALVDVVADATDLTEPDYWYNGTTEGEIFDSIKNGAGVDMPPFDRELDTDENIWHVVNFIFSLWPESKRPTAAGSNGE